eukprot:9171050-Pyramimonas_sp.AAC.3
MIGGGDEERSLRRLQGLGAGRTGGSSPPRPLQRLHMNKQTHTQAVFVCSSEHLRLQLRSEGSYT